MIYRRIFPVGIIGPSPTMTFWASAA